ncbi:MAG TPA: hypoxanthine phosphoribosyltransferase [Dehalococcoidia bacterium]|nr:hypoxanthine phosphoribosyltransferase [Dehalococcoidia bacterium]
MRDKPIQQILLSAEQIQRRVAEIAAEIDGDYAGRDPLVVFIMKGALVFVADLLRAMRSNVRIDFMVVSSYGERTESSGSVRIVADLKSDVRGKDVLLVEDIIDSGLTIHEVIEHLLVRAPASLEVCTLLSKPSRRRVDVPARYVGFEIEDRFVVGYGLDYAERYRGLPYIGVCDPAAAPEMAVE